jgi:phospholipid transport system substrate-binding protein
MINFIKRCKYSLMVLVTALSITQIASANTKDAANFINDLADRVISILKNPQISTKNKEDQLNSIFVKSVDTKWIGKFAMGKYWRSITPTQQEQYLDLYSDYLTGLYVPNFRKYTGNIVKIINVSEVRPKEFLVQTNLTDSLNTMNIKIDYMLIQQDSGIENFVIFDVIAEGVSLITAQRAEVGSVMKDGNFNSLVALLVKKTSEDSK